MFDQSRSLKLTLETALNDLIDDNFKQFMHEEFYKLMFPYIPYDRGAMASLMDEPREHRFFIPDEYAMSIGISSGNIMPDGILFPAYYATNVYYNTTSDKSIRWSTNIHHDHHPLATDHWDEKAMEAHEEELINTLEEYLNRRISEYE